MPKSSAEGTRPFVAWCRDRAGPDLNTGQTKELLERAARLFYLTYLSEGRDDDRPGTSDLG